MPGSRRFGLSLSAPPAREIATCAPTMGWASRLILDDRVCAHFLCDQCGFRGTPGPPWLTRAHAVHHDEHYHGVRLRRPEVFDQVGQLGADPAFLIRPDSSRFARLRTERVSRRAIREPLFEGGYDRPTFCAEDRYQIVPELHTHALVVAHERRGVGLLVMERRERDAGYVWSEGEAAYIPETEQSGGGSWSIAHIWILPSLRGRHLASRLIAMALTGFGVSADDLGWVTPFT
jgi:hypothetical protein